MRRQSKSATVAAQTNLFHMWNVNKDVHKEKGSVDDRGTKDLHPTQSTVGATADIVEGLPAKNRSQAVTRNHTLTAQVESSETEGVPSQTTINPPLSPRKKPGMSRKEKEKYQLVNDTPSTQRIPPETERAPEEPRESQPPRKKAKMSTNEKEKEEPTVESSQSRLFPIFEQKDEPKAKVSMADGEISREKKEIQDRRIGKTGKPSSKPTLRLVKRTASAPSDSSLRQPADDSVSAGPSSQPLLCSPDTIEVIVDDSKMGSNPRLMVGGSQEEPIVIDSSPVKDPTEYFASRSSPSHIKSSRFVRGEAPAVFFAPRQPRSAPTSSKSRKKVGEGDVAKWPDKDSQHVRGAQHSFPSASLGLIRSRPEPCAEDPSTCLADSIRHSRIYEASRPDYEPKYLVEPVGSQPDGHAKCESILQSNASCPAISRFLSADYDISGSSWNERWRPRCAAEVIGNETSSQYLRDWLLALELKTDGQFPTQDDEASLENDANDTEMTSRGVKRPQVIRTVDKPRKRRKGIDSDEESLDDWITDDDEEEEGTMLPFTHDEETEEDWPDDSECGSPWRPKLTRLSRRRPADYSKSDAQLSDKTQSPPTPAHDFSSRLTNTILLAGPPGSGKTAAIYACAEELGWEVFEVYPGIGKRNGTSLLSLVGDVGKNHIVNRASRVVSNTYEKDALGPNIARQTSAESREGRRKTISQAFASFFSAEPKPSSRTAPHEYARTEQSFINLGERETSRVPKVSGTRSSLDISAADDRASTPIENLDSRRIGAQQSIILLEEVDILYSEDVNFWSTVVALIRESRRPVIMTCNDPTLVPSANLPLQTTITFNPCPSDLAISYLQCLTLTEGYAASREHIKLLYETGHPLDVLDISDNLVRSSAFLPSPPDLRRAINSLQFLCQGNPGFQNTISATRPIAEKCRNSSVQETGVALNELWTWDWSRHIVSDCSPTFSEQADLQGKDALGIDRLWQISDTLSMIDSDLSRNPLANLDMQSLITGPPSDGELGHHCLKYEADIVHLQNGIVLYNYDEAIATEAASCARRAIGDEAASFGTGCIIDVRTEQRGKPTSIEFLLSRSQHFARVSGVLGKIVPAVSKENVGALILDYEPWVRSIDRSDSLLEAAAYKDCELRTAARGGRTTRNSQRMQYQRYFDLDEEERKVWQSNALSDRVQDTLCGVDESQTRTQF